MKTWKRRNLISQPIKSSGWHIEDEDGSTVAVVLGTDQGAMTPNVRLIENAPALLALVVSMRDTQVALRNGGLPRSETFIDAADKLIARIGGEA